MNLRARAATDELNALCDRIIADRRAARGTATEAADERDERGERDAGDDLLSLLAAAGNDEDGSLDATEVREQVLIFLLAGHETTATSLAFTLHLLARHPEEQQRVREEIDRVLGERTPTAADLDRLPYLTQALKESMRLYPAAPVVSRRAVAATEIGGYRIPAGADVLVAPWVTHRSPELWEDPERFDPRRFAPEREAERHRYAWFPFGGGPRACIGQHFSMLESVLALAVLLRTYELEAVDQEVPVAAGITLQATGPARVCLRRRDGAEEYGQQETETRGRRTHSGKPHAPAESHTHTGMPYAHRKGERDHKRTHQPRTHHPNHKRYENSVCISAASPLSSIPVPLPPIGEGRCSSEVLRHRARDGDPPCASGIRSGGSCLARPVRDLGVRTAYPTHPAF